MSGNNSKRPSPPSTGNAEPAKDESPGAAQGQSIQKNANDGGGGGDGTVNGGTDSNRGHNNNNNNDANANENENENEQKATVSINSNSNNSTLANSNQNANNEHEANNENKNSSSTTTTTTTTNVNVNISPNPAQNTTTSTTTTTNPNNSSNSLSSSSKKRKKKVQIACIFCRRSHMICDDKRPCTRCVKRNISHLCRDEPINSRQKKLKSPSVGAAAAGQQLLVQPPIVQPAVGGEYGQPVGQPVGQLMGQAFGQTVAQPVTGQPVTGHSLAAQPPNAHVSVQQQQQQPGEIRASESPSGTGYSHGNNANSNEPATGVDAGGLAQSDPNLENSNRNGNNNSHGNANGDKIKPEHEFNGVSGIGGISGGHSSLNNLYSTFAAPQQQNQQQQQQQQQPSPSNNTTTSPAVQPVSSETAQNLDNTNNNNNPTTTTTTNATTTTTTTTTTNHNSSNNNTASNSSNSFGFANNVPSNSGISLLSQLHPFTNQTNPFFYSEHANSEFSSLNEFLSMIDDPDVVNSVNSQYGKNLSQSNSFTDLTNLQSSSVARRGAGAAANGNNGANYSLFGGDPSSGSNGNNGQYLDGGSNTNGFNNQLSSISENAVIGSNGNNATASNNNTNNNTNTTNNNNDNNINNNNGGFSSAVNPTTANNNIKQQSEIPMISDSAKDKFFLTAADPSTEITPEERLKQVIKAKLDAGLLQPYNYAKGYARLQNYMDNYMNQQSRQRILKPLSIFRPAFRAIARTLKDVDLVLVEEAFERMLLDYDRVFTSMAIPACLWRRTGEIYRGNKEFAQLVEVNADALKDGKLTIYELMSEESAVNFWEKYGAIAFDKGQKAVLTSCNLRTKDGRKRKSCCFSFTIRRDRYNIPSCIVGNFIPLDN